MINENDLNVLKIKVRFFEVDSIAIAHHAHFIVWLETSRFDFAERVLAFGAETIQRDFKIPVVKLKADFLKPVHFNTEILVQTIMLTNDTARFAFKYTIYEKESMKKVFTGITHHVILDHDYKLVLNTPLYIKNIFESARERHPGYFDVLKSERIR